MASSDRTRGLRARLDRVGEALSPASVRETFVRLERKTAITRIGQLAILGAVAMWVLAYVVAGTAMYLFAYGVVLLVVVALVIAPRRLKLRGERSGLFPRAQEGDRLDVELTLTAERGVSTFLLEERVPDRLGQTVKVPVTKLARGATVSHRYGLRCARRGVSRVVVLVAFRSDPLVLAMAVVVSAEP